jgi:two-component system, sensor histidine kinase
VRGSDDQLAKYDDALVKRFIALILSNLRAGTILAIVVSMLIGVMIVPSAGWRIYLLWLAIVTVGLIGRLFYFDWILKKYGANRKALNLISSIAAVTGWVAFTCMPVFSSSMSIETLGVLTAIMVGWAAAAVTILAVQPRVYACYIIACLGTVFSSWYEHVSPVNTAAIAFGLVFAGLMLSRIAQLIHSLIKDSVKISLDNDDLVVQLKEALSFAKKAQHARSRFLAAASHDLLQPVHSLKLLINVLDRTTDDQRRNVVVRQIDHSAKSIDGMFRGLLDLAQIDAGTLTAKFQSIPLQYVLETSYAGYEDRCAAKGLSWEVRCDLDFEVHSDPIFLGRITRNLAENALKFTERGGIKIEAKDAGDFIELLTTDTGVGIEAQEHERVFEAFYRGESASSTGADGIGLGLAISKHMTTMLGIELKLISSSSKGTALSLKIPKASTASDASKPEIEWIDLNNKYVIIIDDDKLVLSATQLWFEACGAQTLAVANWPSLQSRLTEIERKPDLIIADFRLHGSIDGIKVVDKVCEKFGYVPAIIISGEKSAFLETAGLAFVQKPIQFPSLIAQIKSLNV